MWPLTESHQRWVDTLCDQTAHEGVCDPCRRNWTPVCEEGLRLQKAAWRAWEAWVAERFVPEAVA